MNEFADIATTMRLLGTTWGAWMVMFAAVRLADVASGEKRRRRTDWLRGR